MTADARLTPYELILAPLEQDAFPAIRAEAEQRGRDALQHDDFLLLGLVGATLSSMIADDAPAEAVDQYGELFWQGYRFWSAGRRFYTFGEAITSTLIAKPYDMDGWQLAAPPSCYVQFPNQRLWTRVAPDAPFEPVDGCFIASDESSTDAGARVDLRVLLVLGLRPERPGISLVIDRMTLDARDAGERAMQAWSDGEAAFETSLPGGERRGLRILNTRAELETLVLRALHALDARPKLLVAHPARETPPADGSHLAYVDVLDARESSGRGGAHSTA
ncbi:MAG TPA: hypothetical protein VN607_05190 [Gemmatimonadaceae bacterium]|nr:hypothetical protein [Gemmatimonadaceae bacterium]